MIPAWVFTCYIVINADSNIIKYIVIHADSNIIEYIVIHADSNIIECHRRGMKK
jgi:carbonic anhydrase/acetyltransferase-like protein (isoleucine patch superfamily)